MKISSVQPYANIQKIYQSAPLNKVQAPAPSRIAAGSPEQAAAKNLTPQTVISPAEREYFMRLFPENSAQISKHNVFNRNGGVQPVAVAKGSIFDGRA